MQRGASQAQYLFYGNLLNCQIDHKCIDIFWITDLYYLKTSSRIFEIYIYFSYQSETRISPTLEAGPSKWQLPDFYNVSRFLKREIIKKSLLFLL